MQLCASQLSIATLLSWKVDNLSRSLNHSCHNWVKTYAILPSQPLLMVQRSWNNLFWDINNIIYKSPSETRLLTRLKLAALSPVYPLEIKWESDYLYSVLSKLQSWETVYLLSLQCFRISSSRCATEILLEVTLGRCCCRCQCEPRFCQTRLL